MLKVNRLARKGAITPLFAILLPVIFLLCGFAINLAYMQLTSAQLKIATDASAHAGGRAMSIKQQTAPAVALAQQIADANEVGGRTLSLTTPDDNNDIQFGTSTRNGNSRYSFSRYSQKDVDSGAKKATSFAVQGSINVPLIFTIMPGPMTSFQASRRSVATQVDRDIALVIDRSGSMLFYDNETALTAAINNLYRNGIQVWVDAVPDKTVYAFYGSYDSKKKTYSNFKGYFTIAQGQASGWVYNPADSKIVKGTPAGYQTQYPITSTDYNNAIKSLYDRRYSQVLIDNLAKINTSMSEYTKDWQTMINSSSSWTTRKPAPRHSRWAFLVGGVDAFLKVLEGTDQEERVTLVTFNNQTYLEYSLTGSYNGIRSKVAGILPYNGTAIGDGMLVGNTEIIHGAQARPFAAKTIVVMTDGENNSGNHYPDEAAGIIAAANPVTIHTLTFATDNQQAQDAMQNVARIGKGMHYHADTGAQLAAKFREIANNLPTILTE